MLNVDGGGGFRTDLFHLLPASLPTATALETTWFLQYGVLCPRARIPTRRSRVVVAVRSCNFFRRRDEGMKVSKKGFSRRSAIRQQATSARFEKYDPGEDSYCLFAFKCFFGVHTWKTDISARTEKGLEHSTGGKPR